MERTAKDELRKAVRSLKDQLVTKDPPGEDAQQWVIGAIVKKGKELRICTEKEMRVCKGKDLSDCTEKVTRRVEYHWEAYASKHDNRAGSRLLAAVIDLPARWIEDVWTGRR